MINGRSNNFDLIRLLTASLVIFFHAQYWLHLSVNPHLLYFLYMFNPIPIFFTISGFLVVKSYIDSKGNLRRYILNRILRLYPGLWVNLLIIFLLLFITGGFKIQDIPTYPFLSRIGILFSIANNCPASLCGITPFQWDSGFYKFFPSGVTWTITVELGFYIIMPLIFFFYVKKKFTVFYLLSALFVLISFYFSWLSTQIIQSHPTSLIALSLYNVIVPYLWIFLIGSFIYLKWNVFSIYLINKFIYWFIFYLALSFICLKVHHDVVFDFKIFNIFNILRIIALACSVISFAYSFQFLNFLDGKMDITYGIYLYHMQVIYTLLYLGFSRSEYLWLIVYGISFPIGFLSWILIEKPCLRIKTWKKSPYIRMYTMSVTNDQP